VPTIDEFSVHLLPLAQCDVAELAALINAAFRRHPVMESDRTSPEDLLDEVGAGEMLLIERDGQLVACAMVQPASAMSEERNSQSDAFYFGLAAVDSAWTGTGLGKRLVRESEAIARQRGFKLMTLGTLREFGLPQFYEKLGYQVIGFADYEAGHWGVTVPHRHCELEKWL